MLSDEQKVELAKKWFFEQNEATQTKAIEQLFEFAIDAEWIGVWNPEDRMPDEEDDDDPEEGTDYSAPYFRTCGEPLGK